LFSRISPTSALKGEVPPPWPRRIWHAFGGIIPLLYLTLGLSKREALFILGPIAFFITSVDLLRLGLPAFNTWFCRTFGLLLKPPEQKGAHGSTYFLIGSFLGILLFEKRVAVVSLLFLAFADPLAAMVGTRWGRLQILGGKTLEGGLAFFLSSLLLALPLLDLPRALLGALSASIVELLPLGIDDNLTIPLLSGLVLSLAPLGV